MKSLLYAGLTIGCAFFVSGCKSLVGRESQSAVLAAQSADQLTAQFPPTMHVGQLSVRIPITLARPRPGLTLDARIDWNGDGSFFGVNEHILRTEFVANVYTLIVDVPSWATSGPKEAWIRVRTNGVSDVSYESFAFTLLPPKKSLGAFGPMTLIGSAKNVYTVAAADLNGDGRMDVLAASFDDNTVAWYENGGEGMFTRHVINSDFKKASFVVVDDLNADGYLDIIACSAGTNTIAWYKNDGRQNFREQIITRSALTTIAFTLADLNHDGYMDVVSSSKKDNMIAWYENNGHEVFTKHVIADDAKLAASVIVVDVNGDRNLDVVSASFEDGNITVYANSGKQTFTKDVIPIKAPGARNVLDADLNGDKHPDLLSASFYDNTVAWYQNDGRGTFKKNILTDKALNAIAVYAADLNGDGRLDILSASRGDNTIAWYENVADPAALLRTKFVSRPAISTASTGAHSVISADLDGDGYLDIITGEQYGGRIAWFKNIGH